MLNDGDIVQVQGSARKPYELKNLDGVYSCTCPAWRNQSTPIDKRTCKHLKGILGDAAELARCNGTSATPEKAAEIHARAAVTGRKLRPDEKAKLSGPPVMLAHSYDGDMDPTGWLYSEKLDGVRGYWDGRNFISRQGNVFHAPDWFKAGLPNHPLDGELWMGRKMFQQTISGVKRLDGGDLWKNIKYVVYDVPHLSFGFEDRLVAASRALSSVHNRHAAVLPHMRITSKAHLFDLLKQYEAAGAEGLMLRRPGSLYEAGRSHDLLKVKPFHDAEAVVIGYEPGKGRHKGRMGALIVQIPNSGKLEFSLGTGFTDAERENPPPVYSWVTYRYTELTSGGIPKCASFLRVKESE